MSEREREKCIGMSQVERMSDWESYRRERDCVFEREREREREREMLTRYAS